MTTFKKLTRYARLHPMPANDNYHGLMQLLWLKLLQAGARLCKN